MKQNILEKLEAFKSELRLLKTEVSALTTKVVSRLAIRNRADNIATMWVEELRSPLEHKYKLSKDVIDGTAEAMKQLHILSRPNNQKSSYLKTVNKVLQRFDNRFILPIKQMSFEVEGILDLRKLIPGLTDPDESDYLTEAISCAEAGFRRAAIVMGWCAVINALQSYIIRMGLDKFNKASTKVKNQKKGKYKNWKKEFSVTTLSELQEVFDTDLLVVLEGNELFDGNQAGRLRTCFQYRNDSAHPGLAPIEDVHLIAFFTDINMIVLQNPDLKP